MNKMNITTRARGRVRTLAVVGGCIAVGAVAGPGLATAAEKLVQDVFVTNTASNPVPVASQGTTRIEGAVTVANQPSPRTPFQRRFHERGGSDNSYSFGDTPFFTVPEGKVLTIEFVQVTILRSLARIERGVFIDTCTEPRSDGTLDPVIYRPPPTPPEHEDSDAHYGGQTKLTVPAGGCPKYFFELMPRSPTGFVDVAIVVTGYLEDAPAA